MAKTEGATTFLDLNLSLNFLRDDSHHTAPVKGIPGLCQNVSSTASMMNSIATGNTEV